MPNVNEHLNPSNYLLPPPHRPLLPPSLTAMSNPHSSTMQVVMKAMCGAEADDTNVQLDTNARYTPCVCLGGCW